MFHAWGASMRSWAFVSVSGKTTHVPLDRPVCVLIQDSSLSSSASLPSIVRGTGATTCTFIVANGATTSAAAVVRLRFDPSR
jgi:hypothetical protein